VHDSRLVACNAVRSLKWNEIVIIQQIMWLSLPTLMHSWTPMGNQSVTLGPR